MTELLLIIEAEMWESREEFTIQDVLLGRSGELEFGPEETEPAWIEAGVVGEVRVHLGLEGEEPPEYLLWGRRDESNRAIGAGKPSELLPRLLAFPVGPPLHAEEPVDQVAKMNIPLHEELLPRVALGVAGCVRENLQVFLRVGDHKVQRLVVDQELGGEHLQLIVILSNYLQTDSIILDKKKKKKETEKEIEKLVLKLFFF